MVHNFDGCTLLKSSDINLLFNKQINRSSMSMVGILPIYLCYLFFIFGSTSAGFWYYVEILQVSCIFTHRKWLKDSSRGIAWNFHVLILAKYWWWFIVVSQFIDPYSQLHLVNKGCLFIYLYIGRERERESYTNLHNFSDIVNSIAINFIVLWYKFCYSVCKNKVV